MTAVRAYIGLGSNLHAPTAQLEAALDELGQLPLTGLVAASSLYSTPPIGPQDQPDFVNAVAALDTSLSPLALLDQLQALEQRHRRTRERHWGPRTLDLDLLLFGGQVQNAPRLTLPHAHMHERGFVLVPLSELANTLADTLTLHQRPLAAWLDRVDTSGIRPITSGT